MHRSPPIARPNRRRARGFTLIELMVAVVVVGVLLSLALPSLLGSIRKSRRSEAFNKLGAVQLAQERFRANNPTYAGNLTNGAASAPPGLSLPATTADGRYTLALEGAPTATTYSVSATPISGSSQVEDGNCALLGVKVVGGNIHYESAPAGGTLDETMGRLCWVR
ncbi:MAG: type IV pilin protein [Pseudomonadota bacterium]|nr:type IV pilin protein [Pseudomonadota bacterium]